LHPNVQTWPFALYAQQLGTGDVIRGMPEHTSVNSGLRLIRPLATALIPGWSGIHSLNGMPL
jgi:hypothetical protein